MRVGIIGSRDYPDLRAVWHFVGKLADRCPDAVIVSGGARGVDTAAAASGRLAGLTVVEHEPEWERHGKKLAPLARNSRLVADIDVLFAFWDGESTGTKDAIDKAEQRGIRVRVFQPSR